MPSSDGKLKVCVIGNSHVASLKMAWSIIHGEYDWIDLVFFADRGMGLKELGIDSGCLVPMSSRLERALEITSLGRKSIDPKDYDMFLVYGVQASALFISPNNFYSHAVINHSLYDHVSKTLSFLLLRLIREVSKKRVYIGHDPLPALLDGVVKERGCKAYLNGLSLLNSELYDGLNAELICQPVDTIVNRKYTDSYFSTGSKRLSIGEDNDDELHRDTDWRHMNDKFGVKWLEAFFSRIDIEEFR